VGVIRSRLGESGRGCISVPPRETLRKGRRTEALGPPKLEVLSQIPFLLLTGVCLGCAAARPSAPDRPDRPDRIDLRFDSAEAEAALEIVADTERSSSSSDAGFAKLESTDGYRRLERREKEMGAPLDPAAFRAFLLSDARAEEAPALRKTLGEWKQADLRAAAERVMAYLPAEARIRATVFAVIKPRKNSFVFEPQTNPAIFLCVDPTMTRAQFENTVAHELHHIGFASLRDDEPDRAPDLAPGRAPELKKVQTWISGFGEGFAMLAAAGGPDTHPHEHSAAVDRERWDHDVANFDADLKQVEKFFLDILDGRLATDEEIRKVGYSFFGVQGPWYTVGWKMAVAVEKSLGRAVLIECMRRPDRLLATYNQVAAEKSARWSPDLLRRLGAEPIVSSSTAR